MSKRHLFTVIAVVAALLAVAVAAQKSTNYAENVTTLIFDIDSTGAQVLLRSDDYNGIGQATYASGGNGSSTVSSVLESNGELQLSFGSSSPRGLWVTPNVPINSSQPVGQAANLYRSPAKINAACRDQNGNIVPFENLVNGSGNCGLGVDFVSNGVEYKLLSNIYGYPDLGANCAPNGCPATGRANVACNAVSNNKCVSWTITPNTDAANATVGSLFQYTGGKTAPWTFVGQYYHTFRIAVTYP